MTTGLSARDEILARVRDALRDVPADETPDDVPVLRDYLPAHVPDDPRALADLLAENLADYRAHVHRCAPSELPATIAGLLERRGSTTLGVPADLPPQWLSALPGDGSVRQIPDSPGLTARELDAVDSVLTGCALAIAETGTIVLDAGPGQGRRVLTLVPDHHICVVRAPGQVVASVPRALPRLDPVRPAARAPVRARSAVVSRLVSRLVSRPAPRGLPGAARRRPGSAAGSPRRARWPAGSRRPARACGGSGGCAGPPSGCGCPASRRCSTAAPRG